MFKYIEEINFRLPPILLDKIYKEVEEKSWPKKDSIFGNLMSAAMADQYVENDYYNKETFKIFKKVVSTRIAQLQPYGHSDVVTLGILKSLPDELKKFNPIIQFQTITNSENYSPHRDFIRVSSLFYLIQSNVSTTRWWEPTEQFKHYRDGEYKYVPPDYDQLDMVKECTLEENKWYVFDHESLHSVHTPYRGGCRISLLVSFKDLPAGKLYDIMIKAGY